MKHLVRHILLPVLLIAAAACTEQIRTPDSSLTSDGKARVSIGVRIPAPVATRAVDESAIDGDNFVIFGFKHDDSEGSDPTLLWALKSGDVNSGSNLTAYQETSSIEWRSGVYPSGYTLDESDGNTSYGTLYFEADATSDAIDVLVLANADISQLTASEDGTAYTLGTATLTPGTSTLSTVEAALSAFDYDAKELTGTYEGASESQTTGYIPMAGYTTLEGGVEPGVVGTVSLRRSLAKVSVTVNYSDLTTANFVPQTMKIMNVSEWATVYAPTSDAANIPAADGETDVYDALTEFGTYEETDYYAASVTAQLYVAETAISSGETHVCVLVGGIYDTAGVYDEEGNLKDYSGTLPASAAQSWYRLDFIPYEADTDDAGEEIEEILRNHHYMFSVEDLSYMGSQSEDAAFALTYPDNYNMANQLGSWVLYVEDEDINSITVAYDRGDTAGTQPDYVGVSATEITITLPATYAEYDAAASKPATHIKMVTNYEEWNVEDSIDANTCEGIFTFSYSEDDETNTDVYLYDEDTGDTEYPAHSGVLWIWADGENVSSLYDTDGNLIEGQYSFYIVVGTVRKQILVDVVAEE
ncbi:MAG: hypothetical protein LUC24_03770 [Bacteroidales bacterium]|nr:hypothetical protein [Bacteroidales bacterium]